MLFCDYWVYFLQIPYYLCTVAMPTTRLNLKMSGWILRFTPYFFCFTLFYYAHSQIICNFANIYF